MFIYFLKFWNSTNPTNSMINSGGTLGSHSASSNSLLKIIKIVSNLVERQEIGPYIVDDVLLDLLFCIYKECSHLNQSPYLLMNSISLSKSFSSYSNQSSNYQQILKEIKKATCNFLFQSFQLYFIWEFCANKLKLKSLS